MGVVTCALNALFLGQVLPIGVYATLLPIIGGVAIASMKELSFTMLALASAMLSNVSSAARSVLSKKTMSGKEIGENLDAQNLYAVLTAMSTVILIPMFLQWREPDYSRPLRALSQQVISPIRASQHYLLSVEPVIMLITRLHSLPSERSTP